MALAKRLSAAVALLLSTTLYSLQANAQDQEGARFVYPDEEGLKFYDDIDVIVRYECPVDVMDLRLWCRRPDDNDWIDEGMTTVAHRFRSSGLFSRDAIRICSFRMLTDNFGTQ
jgi:hypothetical protein